MEIEIVVQPDFGVYGASFLAHLLSSSVLYPDGLVLEAPSLHCVFSSSGVLDQLRVVEIACHDLVFEHYVLVAVPSLVLHASLWLAMQYYVNLFRE